MPRPRSPFSSRIFFTSCAVAACEVAALYHKILYDAMERAARVSVAFLRTICQRFSISSSVFYLSGRQKNEISHCSRCCLSEYADYDPACFFSADLHVQINLQRGSRWQNMTAWLSPTFAVTRGPRTAREPQTSENNAARRSIVSGSRES